MRYNSENHKRESPFHTDTMFRQWERTAAVSQSRRIKSSATLLWISKHSHHSLTSVQSTASRVISLRFIFNIPLPSPPKTAKSHSSLSFVTKISRGFCLSNVCYIPTAAWFKIFTVGIVHEDMAPRSLICYGRFEQAFYLHLHSSPRTSCWERWLPNIGIGKVTTAIH